MTPADMRLGVIVHASTELLDGDVHGGYLFRVNTPPYQYGWFAAVVLLPVKGSLLGLELAYVCGNWFDQMNRRWTLRPASEARTARFVPNVAALSDN